MTLSLMHETRAMSRGLAEPVDKAEELRRLVLRLQDGDRTAFEHLVAKTQNSAYRLGYSVSQDHHIMPVVGYQKPKQLELFLKMIKQGDYQIFSKPEDFENYKKSFIPRFRG